MESSKSPDTLKLEMTRTDTSAATINAERAWALNPEDDGLACTYANVLFQGGDFWKAWNIIRPYAEAPKPSTNILSLAGKLSYMLGYYDLAKKYYERLIDDKEHGISALMGLMLTYYQQNQFDRIRALPFPAEVQHPTLQLIKPFTESPYRLEWASKERVSTIQFLTTDPVPAFTIEVNGVPVPVFFDTGTDLLILDPEVAQALNARVVSTFTGGYGGGLTAETGLGEADSVKAGDVLMRHVPVMTLPTKRFAPLFKERGIVPGGAIGTAFLRQFVSTVDYANGRLILRERNAEGVRRARDSLQGRIAAEIPFALDQTHFMLARGSINGKGGMTFFLDSGLALENCGFTVPVQTLKYLGVPEPERTVKAGVGGGGGVWASAFFKVASIGMGPLVQENVTGEYGALVPEFYLGNGYILDGIISHAFLRRYASWTIDFDGMTYIFGR